jgi:hypothetical protein
VAALHEKLERTRNLAKENEAAKGSFQAGLRIRIHFIRIRIQHFRLNTNPDPDPIRMQGFIDQKLKKFTAEKKNIFLIKNCNLPIPWPP